ncbi:hypothetical protein BU25DRAFT_471155 [Macroventuria anomochaeta]|uniref:Uncharacterized protein n=1 Tax=Macroventuria anomochaeta TaxID=301207 RepID=A0ACB6SFF3_9PLEO|nr:uncharacterized protein BU25DRAFT_471155 [Macroventuria anomochaeta]KAF2633005.1 hypothetical protein BU25DRAFT_471155 [Macroventuria anomochaeta]
MSTDLILPGPSSASLNIDQAKAKHGKGKGKGKYRIEEKKDTEGNESEASIDDPRKKSKGKSKAISREGEGVEEVESDAPPADAKEDDAIDESELSSHVDSESDVNADEETKTARRNEKHAAKLARRAERGEGYYDKRDAADKRQAAATANEGFSNYMSKRSDRKAPEGRPAPVDKEWRGLYFMLKLLWTPGGKAELSGPRIEIVNRANQNIEQYCNQIVNVDVQFNTKANALYLTRLKKLEEGLAGQSESQKVLRRKQLQVRCVKEAGQPSKEELLSRWRFPMEELHGQIFAIEKALKELSDLPSEAAYSKKIADYNQRLAACQSDSKESAELKIKKVDKEKLLAARKDKKTKLLQTALIFLDNLQAKGIPPNSVLSHRAKSVFEDFVSSSKENMELYNALKNEMERPTLEQLDQWGDVIEPMYDFVQCVNGMVTEQGIGRANGLIERLEETNKAITALEEARGDNSLPMSILGEVLRHYKDGQYEQVQVSITRLLEQLRQQEAAVGVVRAIEFQQPPSGPEIGSQDVARPSANATTKPSATVTAESTASSAAASAASVTAKVVNPIAGASATSFVTGTNFTEDMLRNIDVTSLTLGANVAEMFQYDNGMTEHGPLIATRASTTDNARFNRYFVNAGLDVPGLEYYKVLKGSDLGPGGAEKLAEQKVVNFDLKQRKRDIKGAHPIQSIGPCVVMPRAEGYVGRGTKERRPDSYMKVVYKDKPDPELLSRTEFTQLVGQRFGEKQFSSMMTAYTQRQTYFEACKIQKLHPQTRKPLTPVDLEETPWLFPENERNGTKVEEVDEDEDEDLLRGVTIDSGALPADIGDRMDLAETGQASSSSSGQL